MINLIPPAGHTSLKREYLLRVFSTYALLLSGVCIATAVLMVPTYVLVSTELKTTEVRANAERAAYDEFRNLEQEVREANSLIAQLAVSPERMEMSVYINEVTHVAPKDITFKAFLLGETMETNHTFVVQGEAQSRASLLALKGALEASPLFESATIPISDLVRDSNLPFTVTVQIVPPKV